jgi:putative endonuclease
MLIILCSIRVLPTICSGGCWSTGGKTAFTRKNNVTKLVFFECGDDINIAIAREKQIKGGSRKKKLELIQRRNPEWKDLLEEYFGR